MVLKRIEEDEQRKCKNRANEVDFRGRRMIYRYRIFANALGQIVMRGKANRIGIILRIIKEASEILRSF